MNQRGRPHVWEADFYAPRTGVEIALVTMAVVSTVATVAGTIAQGNAAASAASANADAKRRAAALEEQQGVTAYQRQQRLNLINRGKSLAVLSSSGIDPTEGSPLDLLSQQAAEGEFQAEQKKFEHDQRAWLMRMGAGQDDMTGAAAQSAALGKAVGAGVAGAAKVGGMGLGLLSTTPSNIGPTGKSVAAELAAGERPL